MSSTVSPSPTAGSVPTPRSRKSRGPGLHPEMVGWLFMRLSGVLLVALVLGHLFVNLMVGEGVERIDFAFVAGKWANPFWQFWDLSMLWLAQLHGANGMRTLVKRLCSRRQHPDPAQGRALHRIVRGAGAGDLDHLHLRPLRGRVHAVGLYRMRRHG